MHSACKPRCLKEIVRIKRGRLYTIGEAGVRISERELLFRRCFPIDVPFSKIARQCSQACKEVGAKKRRAPSSDHTITEKMSHAGRVMHTIIRCHGTTTLLARSFQRRWCHRLASFQPLDEPSTKINAGFFNTVKYDQTQSQAEERYGRKPDQEHDFHWAIVQTG